MSSGEELHEYVRFTGRQRRDTSLHVLEGLLEGLAMDHVINLKEHRELTITGVCAVDPEIHIEGRTFCFTGVSSKDGRRDFADIVVSKKGNFIDHIRDELDYLIIGDQGNPCWAFSCYGRKVEAAVRMRKAGHHILLVHERDFWDHVAS